MDWSEWMRRTDLDNWVHFDERELDADGDRTLRGGELPWSRSYTARAVAEARLNAVAPWRKWEASSGIPLTADRDFIRLMEEIDAIQMEYDPHDFSVRITRRSECKQNQSLDTAKLDAFIDEM